MFGFELDFTLEIRGLSGLWAISSIMDIDALDERNRWLDLNAEMTQEGFAADQMGGEQGGSLSEMLLGDPYHHRDNKERNELEQELIDIVGR